MAELLEMKGICKRFPGVLALNNVSVTVKAGEVHALLGENGAGKSTLIKVLGGIYIAEEGEIYIEGKKVEIDGVKAAQENGIAIIHQELVLVPHMTVAENIFLGREPMTGGFVNIKKMTEDAQQLLDAYDSADPAQVEGAVKLLRQRVRAFAKDVRDKYIDPPHTTDFAILFVPTEGLYAELVRCGVSEELQREFKVSLAGPTTMGALLNSLQMGFRTLAIQKRSSEVWKVLGAVKTEFNTFAAVLENTKNRLNQAGDELDKLVGVRTRKIQSTLKRVESLPTEGILEDESDV